MISAQYIFQANYNNGKNLVTKKHSQHGNILNAVKSQEELI